MNMGRHKHVCFNDSGICLVTNADDEWDAALRMAPVCFKTVIYTRHVSHRTTWYICAKLRINCKV
jgi:hypothetical protein